MSNYSAVYFNRAAQILKGRDKHVVMQVFQKKENTVLSGMENVRAMLSYATNGLEIKSLTDGDIVQPWEPVLQISGDLAEFVEYESIYLGMLARGSRVATNTRRVVEAAGIKPVYFFGDRFDLSENQASDGYAAMIGGASAVCTKAMQWLMDDQDLPAVGTMPHALIAAFGGNVVEACKAFRETYPDVPLHALVDFENDCVTESIRCLEEFGTNLVGVRLDTSENMVDASIAPLFSYGREEWWPYKEYGDFKPTGVNPQLVHNVREALDERGGRHVKITVSGGFDAEKIAAFEKANVPVDVYAVGSSIVSKNPIDFTADVVYPIAKAGRRLRDSSRLQ